VARIWQAIVIVASAADTGVIRVMTKTAAQALAATVTMVARWLDMPSLRGKGGGMCSAALRVLTSGQ
jgi:hypothetical protein